MPFGSGGEFVGPGSIGAAGGGGGGGGGSATVRTSSATANPGEQTVLSGSTASQTLTLPLVAGNVPNMIVNNSTQVWTIAFAAGTTGSRNGTAGSFNLVPNTSIKFVLIGTVWTMTDWTLAPPQDFTATGTATWVPSGTGSGIFVANLWGGGAAGQPGGATAGGVGGGGGEVRMQFYLGNVSASQTVTVGAGGLASGQVGSPSSIGALVTALGGSIGSGGDGQLPPAANTQVAAGGAGGFGAAASAAGGQGGPGHNRWGAGGGGGGGTNGNGGAGGGGSRSGGGAGVTGAGGGGGANGGSTGGAGSGTTGGTGATASANSGSGGGAGGAGASNGPGGLGGSGRVTIEQLG